MHFRTVGTSTMVISLGSRIFVDPEYHAVCRQLEKASDNREQGIGIRD